MFTIVAFSGSPRAPKGWTHRLLELVLAGAEGAGADCHLVQLNRIEMRPCTGELHCWFKRPGECIHHDGMDEIYELLRRADTMVLGTPMYTPLPGQVQTLLNRMTPLLEPELRDVGGRTRARLQPSFRLTSMALVAASGWWEVENLDTVKRIAIELAADGGISFAGALLRPHAHALERESEESARVLQAALRAGEELVRDGVISQSTTESVAAPLLEADEARRSFIAAYHGAKRRMRRTR
jgi:hypothetical protein